MSELFKLESVSYAYPGGQVALEDITLQISQGERVAILGANASGKSTLLQLLDALIFCSSGNITGFGNELTEKTIDGTEFGRYYRKNVAFLFQNVDAQLFCPTVEEELAFGPRHLRVPEEEISRRVEDMVGLFRLSEIRSRAPQTLSGGEKRRVGLAAVLSVGPSVLMLDEPTTGLDPRTRMFLLEVMEELSTAGKTVIVATHDLELAHDFADRAVVLSEDHKLVADGPADTILHDESLLMSVNLIHVHQHRHGNILHAHPHSHSGTHEHQHSGPTHR